MPAADVVLLPLCITVMVLALIGAAVSVRQRRAGRVVQWLGIAVLPVALYLTGLLRLVWNAVLAVARWAVSIVFSPLVWIGLSLLGFALVLLVVGGVLRRRERSRRREAKSAPLTSASRSTTAVAARPRGQQAAAKPPVDDDMAEIEALLKSRGIS